MKKLLLLVLAFTFTIGISAVVLADCPSVIDEDKMKVDWSDEFDGDSLSYWWAPQRGNGSMYGVWEWGNNEKEFYKDQNISVSDGNLVINAKYEPNAGKVGDSTYNFSSGRIWSKDRIHVGNGYVEAKIKIPSAKGIWPAFWMLGTNGVTWPGCGEIDIMESFNTKAYLQATIHYPTETNTDLYNYDQKNIGDKTEWHTYGCYRDGNYIGLYMDRKLVNYYTTQDGLVDAWSAKDSYTWQKGIYGKRSVLNDDYYLLLNVACGGNLAGGMPSTDLDVNMYVDYVRYYVDGEEPTTETPTVQPTTQAPTAAPTVKPTNKPTSIITTVSRVAKAKIKSLKNVKKKKLKVTFKKIKGVKGYQVRWCDNKSFDGYEQKSIKKTKLTIKHLDKKSTYWVKARAYKKVNGAKTYGKWSAKKKKKIKK